MTTIFTPRKLRLLQTVRSELPFPPYLVAEPRVYEPSELSINPHGAVSIVTPKGLLGVKPGEFEWVKDAARMTLDVVEPRIRELEAEIASYQQCASELLEFLREKWNSPDVDAITLYLVSFIGGIKTKWLVREDSLPTHLARRSRAYRARSCRENFSLSVGVGVDAHNFQKQ